jgi:hypothetical protein
MAFNPFSSFRKYQKFWMASVLLLCMITFVLCTGVGGDLSERLLNIFRPRQGRVYAKLDNRSIYGDEMEAMKRQRDIANEFMQRAIRTVLTRVDKRLKDEADRNVAGKEGQIRSDAITKLKGVEQELQERLRRPRYFEGSSKFEDILDFAMWRNIADRLEIEFLPETVQEMINLEVFAHIPIGGRLEAFFDNRLDIGMIQRDLHRSFQTVNDEMLYRAIRDEFRVRTAQLCLLLAQPRVYKARFSENANMQQMLRFFKLRMGLPDEVRMPLAPMEIWDIFKQKRSQYDIALVPVPVEKFLNQVSEPTDGELQVFFDDFKKTPYDPSSPKPGFMIPAQVKVEWISADPESPYYKGLAQTVTTLEALPALVSSPVCSELAAAAGPLAFRTYLAQSYEELKKGFGREAYFAAPLSEPALPALLSYLSKTEPTPATRKQSVAAIASAIASAGAVDGVIAAPISYRAREYELHAKELESLVAAENQARVKFFAPLPGLAALPFPATWIVLAALHQAEEGERFLPFAAVEPELKKQHDAKLAHDRANANMIIVKRELEKRSGKPLAINLAVRGNANSPGFIQKYGLRHGETKEFRDPFNISKAPELEPLRESFEKYRFQVNHPEGRAGKEERLKEGDFFRLFFDASEPSLSAAVGKYIPRPWPPVVEIKFDNPNIPPKTVSFFDTAEKPFLFWKTADQDSRVPESLKEVRDKVVRAWKIEKARDKLALKQASQIAEQLQKSAPGALGAVVREQAAKLGVNPVYVNSIAELVPGMADFRSKTYHPFAPAKEGFEYPRDDLAKQLLALTKLDKADKGLEGGLPGLDAFNTELLKSKKVQQIQVLTNKPQNVFYVAVVTQALGASMDEFAEVMKRARDRFGASDLFLEIAQDDAGKDFRQRLTAQLRLQMNRSIEADAETIKSFDQSVN